MFESIRDSTNSLSTTNLLTGVQMPRKRPSSLDFREKEASRQMVFVALDPLVLSLRRSGRELGKVEAVSQQGGLLLPLPRIPDQISTTPKLQPLVRLTPFQIPKPPTDLYPDLHLHIRGGIVLRIPTVAASTRTIPDYLQVSMVRIPFLAQAAN